MRVVVALLILAVIVRDFWYIVVMCAVVGLLYCVRAVWRGWVSGQAELKAQRAAIVARCDQQHTWVLDGDPRGTYGEPDRETVAGALDWARAYRPRGKGV